jgi:predicted hydrocarbon binding protein
VHGLIFFYIQKFADVAASGTTSRHSVRMQSPAGLAKYLPSGVYPDADAVQLLQVIADSAGRPLPVVLEEFGEFLAPHLVRVAGKLVDPAWRTLDLIENTESLIHAMIRTTNPGATPPVLEAVRVTPNELHLVYSSSRHLCRLAVGLMRGLGRHYGDDIAVEESTCMLRGDPFCSFVVTDGRRETFSSRSAMSETIVFAPSIDAAKPSSPTADGAPIGSGPGSVRAGHGEPLPTTIGGYSVLSLIDQGGMGRVYLARDDRLDREVAIKVMHPVRAGDPAARRRFIRESRAAAAVEHPHVVMIHQVGEHEGLPFIVMQRLEGRTLAAHRESVGRLPLAEVLRIGRELAEGLAAAHRRGLVHRDIKPDNVFLEGESLSVKIIDFGLAFNLDDEPSNITVDGAVVGTPAYMAPERIGVPEGGDHAIDAKTDLFGLGVILYELLTDRLPFEGRSMVSLLAAISRGGPPHVRDIAPDVPPAVADLVMRLIAHDKADRPADARAVAAEIATLERSSV